MTRRKKKILIISLIIAICAALSAWGFAMETVDYQVESPKLSGSVKIVFISDLHNCFYGDTDNTKLWETVCAAEPDLVLFGGDVIDFKGGTGYSLRFMEQVREKFPCAYTPGNHEGMQSLQLCPTLLDPMDCSPPASSVHRILQARTLELVAMPFSRGSSLPRDQTRVSLICKLYNFHVTVFLQL